MVELDNIRVCLKCNKPYVYRQTTSFIETCSCEAMPSGWLNKRSLNRKEKRDLEFKRGKFARKVK